MWAALLCIFYKFKQNKIKKKKHEKNKIKRYSRSYACNQEMPQSVVECSLQQCAIKPHVLAAVARVIAAAVAAAAAENNGVDTAALLGHQQCPSLGLLLEELGLDGQELGHGHARLVVCVEILANLVDVKRIKRNPLFAEQLGKHGHVVLAFTGEQVVAQARVLGDVSVCIVIA